MSDWLAKGKEALVSGEWHAARDAFSKAEKSAEALEGLAVAAWWLDDSATLFSARERACRLYRESGDRRGAGRVATTLAEAHVHFRGEVAVARGWLRRARRLLDGLDATPERGWLALWEGDLGLEAGEGRACFRTADAARDRGPAAPRGGPERPADRRAAPRQRAHDFRKQGGALWACTPCVKARGYTQEDLLDGVVITGASVVHELIKGGAATLSF